MNNIKDKKIVNIAIIGLGNIGINLYKYLVANKNIIANKTNVIPNIIYVSAKNKYETGPHATQEAATALRNWKACEHAMRWAFS